MNDLLNSRSGSDSHLANKRSRNHVRTRSRRGTSMFKPYTIAKVMAVAAAGAMTLTAAAAQAQPYGYNGQGASYAYDPCQREQTQRGTVGAVLGGGAGAVIGSNAAARNARTEGAILGGLLGALVGGTVGNKSAACTSTATTAPLSSDTAPRTSQYAPPPRARFDGP